MNEFVRFKQAGMTKSGLIKTGLYRILDHVEYLKFLRRHRNLFSTLLMTEA